VHLTQTILSTVVEVADGGASNDATTSCHPPPTCRGPGNSKMARTSVCLESGCDCTTDRHRRHFPTENSVCIQRRLTGGDVLRPINTVDQAIFDDDAITVLHNHSVVDKVGRTPVHSLMLDIHSDNVDFVRSMVATLVEHGANLNIKDKYRKTPWHILMSTLSSSNGDAINKMIEELLELGANPNVKDKYGRTPLCLLVSQSELPWESVLVKEMIDILAEYGANLLVQDRRGRTPLHNLMLNISSRRDWSAIEAIVFKLVELGVDPNVKDAKGRTALHVLMLQLCPDTEGVTLCMVTKLFELGADVNIQDNYGRTALNFLFLHLRPGVCSNIVLMLAMYLMVPKIDASLSDENGQNVFHLLAKKSNRKVGKKWWLFCSLHSLTEYPLITEEDKKGNLPLHYLGNVDAFDPTTTFRILCDMVSMGFLPAK